MKDKGVCISFLGDILSYKCQNKLSYSKGKYDFTDYFKEVYPVLKNSDYVVGSFETPCAGKKAGYSKSDIIFNTPDEILCALKAIGVNMLTTANNHCLDRGIEGLRRTITLMDFMGIEHTGTFLHPESQPYLIKDFDNFKIAFISYTYGTNSSCNGNLLDDSELYSVNLTRKQEIPVRRPLYKKILLALIDFLPSIVKTKIRPVNARVVIDSVQDNQIEAEENVSYVERMKEVIRDAKSQSDRVVFLLHSGGQFNSEVGPYTKWIINNIVEAGADIVVCNHTHSVLPLEVLEDGKIIAYSLGNFSFTPGEGYYVAGVYSDYSIVLNLFMDSCDTKISFSICKSVVDKKGLSKVVPLFDLFNIVEDSEREKLLDDAQKVYQRFVGFVPIDFKIEKEYMLDCHKATAAD